MLPNFMQEHTNCVPQVVQKLAAPPPEPSFETCGRAANVRELEFPQSQPGVGSVWDSRFPGVERACNMTKGEGKRYASANSSLPAHRSCRKEATFAAAVELNLGLTRFEFSMPSGCGPTSFFSLLLCQINLCTLMAEFKNANSHLPSFCIYFWL